MLLTHLNFGSQVAAAASFRIALSLALVLMGAGTACNAFALSIALARGADAEFSVTISNSTDVVVPSAVFEGLAPPAWIQREYSISTLNPTTCSVGYGNLGGTLFPSFEISASSVPAHGAVTCSIQVHRASTSFRAFVASFQPINGMPAGIAVSDIDWIIGPIADLSIRSQEVNPWPLPGQRAATVEIVVSNKGPWDVTHADFGYCQDVVVAPFELDNDVPGACEAAVNGPACFSTGLSSVQFGISSVAAGQTKSCNLRVTAIAPITAPIGFPLFLVGEPQSSTGEYPADTNMSDNVIDLVVAPEAIDTVPFSTIAWEALAIAMMLAGLVRASRLNRR